MYDVNLTPGERIRYSREDKGYSRERLAFEAEISPKCLYEVETNRVGFSAATLMKLSKTLNESMDYLMTGIPYKENQNQMPS